MMKPLIHDSDWEKVNLTLKAMGKLKKFHQLWHVTVHPLLLDTNRILVNISF